MHKFDVYLGETENFNPLDPILTLGISFSKLPRGLAVLFKRENYRNAAGVWNGVPEVTTIHDMYTSNETAERRAYALTALTGNDAILITRLAKPRSEETEYENSFRAKKVLPSSKADNHTLDFDTGERYRFVPDPDGDYIAKLVIDTGYVFPLVD